MTKKIVFGVAAVALAAVVMAPAASAACGSVRTASTYNSATTLFAYWHAPSGDTGTINQLDGQTWQLGNFGQWNGGNCATTDVGNGGPGFLYFGTGGIGLNMHMESCGNGCPSPLSTLAVLAQKIDPSGVVDFLFSTQQEIPGPVNYDYSLQGDHNMIRLPTPVVQTSSLSAGVVSMTVTVPSIAAGLFGPNAASGVSGYKILSALSATDPGNLATSYPNVAATISAAGGSASGPTTFTLPCSAAGGADQWVATQITFENGTVLSDTVSGARRVHCGGAVADPKYKIVPKKTAGVAPSSH